MLDGERVGQGRMGQNGNHWNSKNMPKILEAKYKLPISIEVGKRRIKKKFLNLNLYRNAPFHENNTLKKKMKMIVAGAIEEPFYFECFELYYTVFLPDIRRRDISNVLSIIDKYQCDALVELGYVPDDNYHHLKKVVYEFGGVDPNGKGYVEILVKEVECVS